MNDPLQKLFRQNLEDTPNAISSQELEDGALPCNSQDGQQTDLFGQDHAPASHSVAQENKKAKQMKGTCGLSGTASSASAALQQSLESKLAARLPTGGLTMFIKGWKQKVTPLGRRYCQLAVSVRPINGTDYGLWPTVTTNDATGSQYQYGKDKKKILKLTGQVKAMWSTPRSTDGDKATRTQEGAEREFARNKGPCLATTTKAMWPTPTVRDHKDTGDLSNSMTRQDGKSRLDGIPRIAYGSTAQTENKGSLNPQFPCWLMGYPIEWDDLGATVTLSSRKSQRNS